jgi:Fe-S-cluster containining protein
MKNKCGNCRTCCEELFIKVSKEDIESWKEKNRYDIVLCVENWSYLGAFLIRNEKNGWCIFLDSKNGCEIYDLRPKVCRDFPKSKAHAAKVGCKLTV